MEIEAFQPIRDAWFLTGATASGKTGVGLEWAQQLGAEIISLDSMAVYTGMDIGTAKPPADDQAVVPHHLIDVVSPDQEFSLSEYLSAAHAAAEQIRERGKQVLFVGGTPLYLKALLRGLFPGPPADWEFRNAIEEEIASVGLEPLYTRLQQVDPLAAAKLHPHDKRRIIRALEVNKATGRPLSHEQTQFEDSESPGECPVFTLLRPRKILHHRIEERVDGMFERGLVDEVRGLLADYEELSRTALQAVGYGEVVRHVRGELELEATISAVKTRTRQFARRQETWFRSLSECRMVPVDESETAAQIAERLSRAEGQGLRDKG